MELALNEQRWNREWVAARLRIYAEKGVWFGTSSWKYEGWLGMLYDRDRYIYRGKFSESRFERQCLTEYAQVFRTVGVDAAYYQFPRAEWLLSMASEVPTDFKFSFKVTDDITMKRFPSLPRFGARAGKVNEHFLDAALFEDRFLGSCSAIREKVGMLMFEFTRFSAADYGRGREFLVQLDDFLGRLPKGWPYAVEIRNATFLGPEYLGVLRAHGVAHLFNSWEAMPSLEEQIAMEGGVTSEEQSVMRLLLRPGRKYADAVTQFSPYRALKEVNAAGRAATMRLVKKVLKERKPKRLYVYVNNRFEGNALQTVEAILKELDAAGMPGA